MSNESLVIKATFTLTLTLTLSRWEREQQLNIPYGAMVHRAVGRLQFAKTLINSALNRSDAVLTFFRHE
jgi:hypothetical protein